MDYYFLIITIIDIFVLGIMCVLTKDSETLNAQKRLGFIQSFLLIILISILEVITILVDNKSPSLRWINILSNYLAARSDSSFFYLGKPASESDFEMGQTHRSRLSFIFGCHLSIENCFLCRSK